MVNSKIKFFILPAFVALSLSAQVNAMDTDVVDGTSASTARLSQSEADKAFILRKEEMAAKYYATTDLPAEINEYLKTPGSTLEQAIAWLSRFKVNERQEKLFGGYGLQDKVADIWNAEIAAMAKPQ